MPSWHTTLIILHLLGIALGAGGALASDWIFLISARDGRISRSETRFLSLGSKLVWSGVAILALSGLGLFLLDPIRLLSSPKFLAKMSIVLIIILNGISFHFLHLPRIKRHAGEHFPSSDEFMRYRFALVASGAISFVSWISALILGAWRNIPFSYLQIMLAYLACLIFAISVAYLAKNKLVPR